MEFVAEIGEPLRFTATQTLVGAPKLMGILCSTSTGGTITIADLGGGGGAARTLISLMPLTAGQFYPLLMNTIGTVTITVAGTLDATLTMVR